MGKFPGIAPPPPEPADADPDTRNFFILLNSPPVGQGRLIHEVSRSHVR